MKNDDYKAHGTISACAPNHSTCAANPIPFNKLSLGTFEVCAKELQDINQSEIYKFDYIVKVFNEKNDLLRECLFFLSAFVDDDFCNDLKIRIENHLGIKFKNGKEK